MNVIDVGCSYIKSYLVIDNDVVNCHKIPTRFETLKEDVMRCFEQVGRDHSQSTIVISTSDSVVVEDKDGRVGWREHDFPAHWMEGQTPYKKSGHPRYEKLKGCANQMIHEAYAISDFPLIKRILPVSAYVATLLADNPDWNGWDITHATNSGFWDYDKAGWADEAKPFIDAGVIDAKVYPCDTLVEGNTFRRVFLGGHDSVFTNAVDTPYSTKPYISCGTWTTVSVPYDMERGIPDRGVARYIAAPNGSVLKQLCFPSDPKELKKSAKKIYEFLSRQFDGVSSIPKIQVFGLWSKEMYDELTNPVSGLRERFNWIEPHKFWGCLHLPLQAERYVRKSGKYQDDTPYFCEGA